jgi:hypothetical protein
VPDLPAFTGDAVEAVTYAPQQVESVGHSYVTGAGVTDPRNRFTAKLGRLINSAEANRGVSGSLLSSHASGGWQSALQNLLGSAADVKYFAARQACLICSGINDLNTFGPGLGGFRDSLRTVISRMRSAFVFENTDASIVYSGAAGADWTQVAATTENSGSSYRSAVLNGATYTITMPADLPARSTIAIGITGRFGGQGARHTFTVNGQAVGFIDAINAQASGYVGYVYRIKGVNPGDVIVGTISNVQTITSLDYWQVEAAIPPTVLICLQPYLVDYSAYGAGGAFGVPTDAWVDQLNGAFRSVAAEFDKTVIPVDLSGIARQAAYFQADKLHPNELGHSYIADRLVAAWRTAPKLTPWTAAAKAGLRLPDGGLFVAAGPVGTLNRKIAVIDTNGAIIGYIPLYDAIT